MIGNNPITPKNPNEPLRVISVGRLSQPKETEAETERSLEAIRHENERMLAAVYSGPKHIEYLGEQTSGLLAKRDTMDRLWQLVETGEWDLIVAEDLSRIFRNPRFQLAFVQDAVDAGIRVICFADQLDTGDDNWETSVAVATLRHGLLIPDTRRRIKRTATETFRSGGQVGKVRASHLRVSKEDAASGKYGPKGLRIRRNEEFGIVLEEIRRHFAGGSTPQSVVAWMNSEHVPTGRYVTSGRWTVKLLRDLLQDPLLHGTRLFRKVLNKQVFSTGKFRRNRNPEPEQVYIPGLARMTREEQEVLLSYVGWKIDWNGVKARPKAHPRKGVPWYESVWPGQSATCGICGGSMYVVGECLKCKNSLAACEQTCWNHVQAPISRLRAFVVTYLIEQIQSSDECRDKLLTAVRRELQHSDSSRAANRNRQIADISALQLRERNLRKSIGIANSLSDIELTSLVEDLAAVTSELKLKKQQAKSKESEPEPRGMLSDDEIVASAPEILMDLLSTSFEMAEIVRGLVPKCVIVPVQAFDTGQVHPRAKLWVQNVGGQQGNENSLREVTLDLFDLPLPLTLMPEAVRLRSQSPRPTLKQVGQLLGTSYMTIKRALDLARKMEASGLTDPMIELTSKPAYASRWRDAS